jgi:hypothetical protein
MDTTGIWVGGAVVLRRCFSISVARRWRKGPGCRVRNRQPGVFARWSVQRRSGGGDRLGGTVLCCRVSGRPTPSLSGRTSPDKETGPGRLETFDAARWRAQRPTPIASLVELRRLVADIGRPCRSVQSCGEPRHMTESGCPLWVRITDSSRTSRHVRDVPEADLD